MIINIDQTGIPIIPISNWDLEAEGTSEVAFTGLDDKDHWCYGGIATWTVYPPSNYLPEEDQHLPSKVQFLSWH